MGETSCAAKDNGRTLGFAGDCGFRGVVLKFGKQITGGFYMFTDGRSKRVVFIAHCFLNQNSISDGTAVFPAAFKDMIRAFMDADV